MNRDYTQNRELSWLKFNERVLMEAVDETVPLLERMKFVSIFTSNLDEFFMIRVGSLTELLTLKESPIDKKSGMDTEEQLEAVYRAVRKLYKAREDIYKDLEKQLRVHGICNLSYNELENHEKKYLKKYFNEYISPILSPQIVDDHHPFPHLQNKTVHIGTMLGSKDKKVFAVIPIPLILPPIIFLKDEDCRYIKTEDVISAHLSEIFTGYSIKERLSFCITRNADINPNDEAFDFGYDFRKKMKKILKERRRLEAVRLEISTDVSDDFIQYLTCKIGVSRNQTYVTSLPFKMDYAFSLGDQISDDKRRALSYDRFDPQSCPSVNMNQSIMKQAEQKDFLLSLPYESLNPFVTMIKEASEDPAVVSIKITIYRLASHAKIVDYLCAAAESGKDVTVIIELRARFDEQNNIDWSERLDEAGCNVIYGFEDYKVHSKVCLITRREKGNVRYITQIGTGNYNEKTATQYTDISLVTGNQEIGEDCAAFFKNMAIGNLESEYRHILAAPFSLKKKVIEHINDEISKRENGRIILKMNSVTDLDIIEKLKQASCAGVQIDMIIRGICCIIPGIEGKTENIRIKSIVGRYLEHSRVYCFGRGEEEKMYISSADFMTRNTERRVELACPIFDKDAKEKIHNILLQCLADNVKGRLLQNDAEYVKVPSGSGDISIDCQQVLMNSAIKETARSQFSEKELSPVKRFLRFVSKLSLS